MTARCSAWLSAAALSAVVHGEQLPSTPVLRIDTGRHTAFIHALALDESADRLYSASEDKTIRVWRVGDGRLLDTFRVPIGTRAEGQLYALALSPDYRTLAAGGWTCWDSEGSACVYFLDAASGAITGRITGLPEVVAALRFSPDGQALAVGLMGGQGLRVYRVADRSLLTQDRDYRDKLLELDFSAQGQLIATALDGFVRLYDAGFNLLGRANVGLAGNQPFGVRFSPDGRSIALAFNDVAKINVLRSSDLGVTQTLTLAPRTVARSLTRVAWSADGTAIYGAGETASGGPTGIFHWRLPGAAMPDRPVATTGRIGDLVVTRSGFVAFAADDPALGLIDPQGALRYLIKSGVPDYRAAKTSLRIARDASDVEIAVGPQGHILRRYSVLHGTLALRATPSVDLLPPTESAAGWRIAQDKASSDWAINGRNLPLDPYESLNTWSIAPRGDRIVLGSEWRLRMLDRAGVLRWSVRTATSVRAVNVSANGRYVVAVLADGTINWHVAADGALMLSLFLHADGEDWAIWAPSGEYASSAYGDTLVGWHVNRGASESADFFRAVQFERELYKPQKIASQMLEKGGTTGNTKSAADARELLAILPPRLTVSARSDSAAPGRVQIHVSATSSGLPMKDVALYVNDIPVTPARERALAGSLARAFERDFSIPLTGPEANIRVEVFNGRSLGVAERYLALAPGPDLRPEPADLYLLAVGVDRFPGLDPSLTLSSAASDAEQFAAALGAVGARRFRHVHVRTLSDKGVVPDRAAVLAALGFLAEARGTDTVVLFLASHGISDLAGNYYFVPRDVKRADVDVLLDGKPLQEPSSLIGWQSFFDALRGVAGQRLLIVDTCQARNITGNLRDFSLVKRSASSHIAFVLAARGDEESQEYAPANHGLFTFGLLQGLTLASDRDGNGIVTLAEWFRFAAATVERLRDRSIGPQTPQFVAPQALQVMTILGSTQSVR